MKKITFLFIQLLVFAGAYAGVAYVTPAGAGLQNGSSWANAFSGIQFKAELDSVPSGTQFWVAAGVYYPGTSGSTGAAFDLHNGVSLYGGFNGTEVLLTQRNPAVNTTVLSGDLDQSGNLSANDALNVVYSSGNDNTAVIDGFTITGGNAVSGGGGGGIYITNGNPVINNCNINNNYAANFGGGIYCDVGGNATISACYLINNTANFAGGAIRNNSANPYIVNCVFSGNYCYLCPGIESQSASLPTIVNCSFYNNSGGSGLGTLRQSNSSNATIVNCIIWNNSSGGVSDNSASSNVSYTDIQGGWAGAGGNNIDSDPQILNPVTLQISACSPAVNAGTNTGAPVVDIADNLRPYGPAVDLGAWEVQSPPAVFTTPAIGGSTSICPGGSATIGVVPSYTGYIWSNGDSTQNISVSTNASLTVTVTDGNGCTGTAASPVLGIYTQPVVAGADTVSLCSGQPYNIKVSGGAGYTWSPATGLNQLTGDSVIASPADTTVYTITSTSPGNCTVSFTYNVLAPLSVTIRSAADTICDGDSVLLSAVLTNSNLQSGQTAFVNSTNAGGANITCNCPPGYVAVGYTGRTGDWLDQFSLGCQKLNRNGTLSGPVVYTSSDGSSTGGNANGPYLFTGNTAMVGISGYQNTGSSNLGEVQGYGQSISYIQAAGNNASNPVADGALAGGNTFSLGSVYAPPGTVVTGMVGWNTQYATGVSLIYTPIALFYNTYLWSTGDTTPAISVNYPDSFTVTVTPVAGCAGTSQAVKISVDTVSITAGGDTVLCYGDSVILTASAGMSYSWSDGESTRSITVKSSGLYAVTVNGCSSVNKVNVLVHPASSIQTSGTTTFCQGFAINLVASYGTSYLWNTGATTDTIVVSTAGTFTVNITDTFGCHYTDTIITQISPLPAPQLSSHDNFVYCPVNGYTDIEVSNNGPRYATYLWSDSTTASTDNVTDTGTVNVTVSDAYGCTASASAVVLSGAVGNPAVFGQHVWNVYAWNAGGQYLDSTCFSQQYSGYYIDTNLAYNSTNYWCNNCSPSNAPGYMGCPVNQTNISYSANRKGFPCGYYQIDIPAHDDAAELLINGQLVWVDSGCCDVNLNVWQGILDSNTEVIFRITQGPGATDGIMAITPLNYDSVIISGATSLCKQQSVTLTSENAPSYLWSNGATTQAITISTRGTYSVSISGAGCGFVSQSITVDTIAPAISGLPQNISVASDSGQCGAVVTFNTPVASDVCSGLGYVSFAYTGAYQTWVVPAGVTSIKVDAAGATGGTDNNQAGVGGNGARVQTTLPVTPGDTLYINIGGAPATYSYVGGYNGGGNAYQDGFGDNGGAGGGYTAIGKTGNQFSDTLVVAAGGGGSGIDCGGDNGGQGGGPNGTAGLDCGNADGGGATQNAGGAGSPNGGVAGSYMQGGNATGVTPNNNNGGGGGGGYYGGGSGYYGGGGGGSSYVSFLGSNTAYTTGYNSAGNGYVNISYGIPFNAVQTAGLPSGSVYPVGTTTVTFTAVDSVGGTSSASFIVTVTDTTVPVITCPGNIVTTAAAGACGTAVNFNVSATDNCSVQVVSTPASGSIFSLGTTTVNSVATDPSGNQASCSFTVTVNPTPVYDTIGICTGGTYNFNGTAITAAGDYTDTISSAGGCDSIIHLNVYLHTNPVAGITGAAAGCGSVLLTASGGTTYNWSGGSTPGSATDTVTSSNTYTVTVTDNNGCSASALQAVTVYQTGASQFSQSICAGQVYNFNNQSLGTTGAYYDTLQTIHGCDSIVTLNLTVNQVLQSGYADSTCSGTPYIFFGQSLTAAGIYKDTLQSVQGCDSVITLTLTIKNGAQTVISDTACSGNVFVFNNQNLTTAGVYTDTLQTVNGCDSVVTLTLLFDSVPQPVIMRNGDTLQTQVFSTYQWFRNGVIINDATTQVIIIQQNGNYSVSVTGPNGCGDTSEVLNVNTLGVQDLNSAYGVKLYPNPNNGSFVLQFTDDVVREVEITDAVGRMVMSAVKVSQQQDFSLQELSAGVYMVRINEQGQVKSMKFTLVK